MDDKTSELQTYNQTGGSFFLMSSQPGKEQKSESNNQEKENENIEAFQNIKKKKELNILSGFFPVFIYFSFAINSQTLQISKNIKSLLQQNNITYNEIKEKHITVSKTINILESEVKQLHTKIQKSLKGRVILPIVLLFKKIRILSNFICLEVEKVTSLKLQNVTSIIGETIKEPYFENPIYHASLFKLVQQPSPKLVQNIQNLRFGQKTAILLENLYMNAGIKKIKFSIK